MKMSKLTAAYLAGIMDGEGHISLCPYNRDDRQVAYYKPNVKVTVTDQWFIEWLKASFGGYIYKKISKEIRWKDAYTWSTDSNGTEEFLRIIYPYMRIKKRQCELVLERIKLSRQANQRKPNIYKTDYSTWRVYTHVDNKQKYLGSYDSEEKALAAYKESQPVNWEPYNVSEKTKRIEEIYNELRKLNKRGQSLHAERLSEVTLRGSDSLNLQEKKLQEERSKNLSPAKAE